MMKSKNKLKKLCLVVFQKQLKNGQLKKPDNIHAERFEKR